MLEAKNILENEGSKLVRELKENKSSRYLSWKYCYNEFQTSIEELRHGKEIEDLDQKRISYLALHLAFYLASWGMYRGSSFLLQYDYKIHIDTVKKILNKDYTNIWNIQIENLNDSKYRDRIKESLFKLKDELIKIYQSKKVKMTNMYTDDKENDNINITDTLVTKILLGTIGCIPAYDRFVVSALKRLGIKHTKFSKDSFEEICNLCYDNQDVLKKLKNEKDLTNYPIMKILDMCLWKYGLDLENTLILISEDKGYKEKIEKEIGDLINDTKNKYQEKLNKNLEHKLSRLNNIIIEEQNNFDNIRGVNCFLIVTNRKDRKNMCELGEVKKYLKNKLKI